MKVIGIDAGGTNTIGRLIEDEYCIKKVISGYGNVLEGKKAIEHISQVLIALWDDSIDHVVIGIAGYESYPEKKHLYAQLSGICGHLILISDIELAYHHLISQKGILVLAGTGSVVLTKTSQGFLKAGGWGHLLGDQGSAYSIGLRGIKKVIAFYESGEDHPWIQQVLDFYGFENVEDLKYLYGKPKKEIAQLAVVVDQGSWSFCQDIIASEAMQLGLSVKRLITVHQLEPELIALTGSVMNSQTFVGALKKSLSFYPVNFIVNLEDHTLGGWYYVR